MTVENSQLGQAPFSPVPEDFCFSDGTERPGSSSTNCPKTRTTWRRLSTTASFSSRSYNAMHHQQEQSENAVEEHQPAEYGQVQMAAACATSRAAAHVTSRFRDTDNIIEANFQSSTTTIMIRKLFRGSPGTRSSATDSGSRSYSRDDTERC